MVVADVGLADRVGTVPVHVDERYLATTSMIPLEVDRVVVDCAVETGDFYMDRLGIDGVDVLKIDTEGADLRVLHGFSNALAEGRIGLVQFELTLWAAIARTWLADFYELLEPAGFTIGKVYPTFVDWRDYRPEHEQFAFRANFAAVHRDRDDLGRPLGL